MCERERAKKHSCSAGVSERVSVCVGVRACVCVCVCVRACVYACARAYQLRACRSPALARPPHWYHCSSRTRLCVCQRVCVWVSVWGRVSVCAVHACACIYIYIYVCVCASVRVCERAFLRCVCTCARLHAIANGKQCQHEHHCICTGVPDCVLINLRMAARAPKKYRCFARVGERTKREQATKHRSLQACKIERAKKRSCSAGVLGRERATKET